MIKTSGAISTPDGFGQYQDGRNLLEVLGVATPAEAMDILCVRLNNGVSAANGEADFSGLQIGDYIPGIDLSAIPAENGGDAGQPYDVTYRNNDIVLSGFNTYLGIGSNGNADYGEEDVENTKNHLLWTFKNAPLRKKLNASEAVIPLDDYAIATYPHISYCDSDLRAFLEGVNGDGTGDKEGITTAVFMNVLKAQIGDHLYTITKTFQGGGLFWSRFTVSPPSELEVFGNQFWGKEGLFKGEYVSADDPNDPIKSYSNFLLHSGPSAAIHFPIFSRSTIHRIKRYNGARASWWAQTQIESSLYGVTVIGSIGDPSSCGRFENQVIGCAPVFCTI